MHVWLCVFLFILREVLTEKTEKPGESRMGPSCDDLETKAEELSEPIMEPVPFGHITREGFGDPFLTKQPIDFLELMLRTPKNLEEEIKMLKAGRSNILVINPHMAKMFLDKKEETFKERIERDPPPEASNHTIKWPDLAAIQHRNAMYPHRHEPHREVTTESPVQPMVPKKTYFAENTFHFAEDGPGIPSNWTTCDQFAVKAVFSPRDVVDVKWIPFYVWTDMGIAVAKEHTFEFPTVKLVQEYRAKYGIYIQKTIDWEQPKLLLKGISEMLLIAADKRGLFDAIVKHEIPESIQGQYIHLPPISLRLKIEDPYLVMMHCEYHYATVMAISGNEPTNIKEMEAEAATINFVGTGRPLWKDPEEERRNVRLLMEAQLGAESEGPKNKDAPSLPTYSDWYPGRMHKIHDIEKELDKF